MTLWWDMGQGRYPWEASRHGGGPRPAHGTLARGHAGLHHPGRPQARHVCSHWSAWACRQRLRAWPASAAWI